MCVWLFITYIKYDWTDWVDILAAAGAVDDVKQGVGISEAAGHRAVVASRLNLSHFTLFTEFYSIVQLFFILYSINYQIISVCMLEAKHEYRVNVKIVHYDVIP